MILTEKCRNAVREICSLGIGRGSNTSLGSEKPATNRLSHETALTQDINVNSCKYYIEIEFLFYREKLISITETNGIMLFGKTVAFYWENNTKHISIQCVAQNAEILMLEHVVHILTTAY
jgi:hypothetical protein